MGYDTSFKGELKFTTELKASQIAKVESFMGEDCRRHPEWKGSEELTWINLELLHDYSGIKWDESEKSYDMVAKVNMIIRNMQDFMPEFGLEGKMIAQGEDIEDRWELVMIDNQASARKFPHTGQKITCPHCEEGFYWLFLLMSLL